ncbi:MAG: VWA domain-containing protein, partial [Halobacteriaceae archaeon]
MTASDIEPERIDEARRIGEQLIATMQDRGSAGTLGLLSFSGSTYIEETLTDNYRKIRRSLEELQIREEGGTDLAGAIVTGVNLLADSDS